MKQNSCTFFGHRDCPISIKPNLKEVIINLIENGVTVFYVGNNGSFDMLVQSVLFELSKEYIYISYRIILAYPPKVSKNEMYNTIYPSGIEKVPYHFAIPWRNRWMLDKSDYVVTYITHSYGNAFKYAELAKKKSKTVKNIVI